MGKVHTCGADSNRPTISTLTEAERQVYELYCQGLSAREIATKLNKAYSGIHTRLGVAREKVQAAGWK